MVTVAMYMLPNFEVIDDLVDCTFKIIIIIMTILYSIDIRNYLMTRRMSWIS